MGAAAVAEDEEVADFVMSWDITEGWLVTQGVTEGDPRFFSHAVLVLETLGRATSNSTAWSSGEKSFWVPGAEAARVCLVDRSAQRRRGTCCQ